jgi:hypothetical protein
VHFLPIGLENRWYSEHGEKLPFVLRRHFLPEKKQYRILSCFSVRTNPLVRLETRNVVSKLPLVDHFGPVSSSHHRSLLSKYAFVISPPGNGVDCHRTWEAFYLHSIPIVLRSAITEYYLDIGLPVWIVDNYVEVGTLDEVALRDKYEEMKSRFESPALWMDYWISRIGTEKTYDS